MGGKKDKLPLFVWAVLITAVLLLLSLPVLAAYSLILAAQNPAIYWNNLFFLSLGFALPTLEVGLVRIFLGQSEGNQYPEGIGILRDYTPELIAPPEGQGGDPIVPNTRSFFKNISSSFAEAYGMHSHSPYGNTEVSSSHSAQLAPLRNMGVISRGCPSPNGVSVRHFTLPAQANLVSNFDSPPLRAPSEGGSGNRHLFAHYLAGLIEGDGSIIVPNELRDNKGRKKYPSIQIAFHSKDLPFALIIQKILKCGSISKKKGANAYVLSINNFEGWLIIIDLINGKMKTPKIHALYRLIDFLNLHYGCSFTKLPLNLDPLDSTPWFSGFIDADGSFFIRFSKAGKYPAHIECRFIIVQRQIDISSFSLFDILNSIANFLSSTVKQTKTSTNYPNFEVRTLNLNSNSILVNYLDRFPLFSSKYLDYLVWKDVLNLFKNGEHHNDLGRDKIFKLKMTINNSRTVFIWDHLNKFYE